METKDSRSSIEEQEEPEPYRLWHKGVRHNGLDGTSPCLKGKFPTCGANFRKERNIVEEPILNEPGANAPRDYKDKFKKHMDDMLDVGCLMLASMTPELQKQHEDMVAYEMIQNLKEIYEGRARQER
ncbi:hypothetical protein V6N12_050399 [Hibiscus sabdariffa]|uniref:Uncharacterized protein n=1 Tax=Hibiscus sabdariffa TaxID=183260 RepID=A0ABR2GCA3_9ROSI